MLAPLTDLIEKDKTFLCKMDQQNSFSNIKKAICDVGTKRTIHCNKPIILTTDASGRGWGVVIEQDGFPVDFTSEKWNDTELRYSTTKKSYDPVSMH